MTSAKVRGKLLRGVCSLHETNMGVVNNDVMGTENVENAHYLVLNVVRFRTLPLSDCLVTGEFRYAHHDTACIIKITITK